MAFGVVSNSSRCERSRTSSAGIDLQVIHRRCRRRRHRLPSREALDAVLQPKIRGTLVLEALLKHKKLDFFLLCSSLNAFLGEGGISDYSGANAFLDAFAHSRKDWATPPVSIQWDSWEDVGMVAEGWFDRPKGPKAKPVVEALDHPFFESRFSVDGTDTYVVNLSTEDHWVVGEHVLMGTPTLVGTTHLQFAHGYAIPRDPLDARRAVPGALVMKDETRRELHVVLSLSATVELPGEELQERRVAQPRARPRRTTATTVREARRRRN
jgi:polyketide synthase PksJ